jgi:Omp85 superfamily domain
MSPSRLPAAPARWLAAWCGGLLAFCGPALARPITSVASLRIVRPADDRNYRPVFSEAHLAAELRAFVGMECDPAAIAESLSRPYRFLGYVPSVEVSCDEGGLVVQVRESSHIIALIAFDPTELTRIGVSAAQDYEDKRPLYPVQDVAARVLLSGLIQTRAGDLYNFERYRSDSEAVGRLGYAIAFIPGAPGPSGYPAGAYLIQGLSLPPGTGTTRRHKTNYLGGSAAYGPREKGSLGLLYQKDQVFGRFDQFTLTPAYNSAVGGDLTYRAPWLASHGTPRRLYDIDIGLFSRFTHNRVLSGVETDERRTGTTATLGFRPLGLPAPHDLRFQIGVTHSRVSLQQTIPGSPEVNLTMLQLGLTHEWRHTYHWPSVSTRLQPSVDFAFDGVGGQRTFVRPGLDATLHARTAAGLEYDLHLLAGTIDRHAPAFELWSLGGIRTVRGFREDAFLARHMAALQAEIWLPFVRPLATAPLAPGTPLENPEETPWEPRGARRLRWAVFVDGGYGSGTEDGTNPDLLGAGVGIRFVVPRRPLVIRLDYGRGLGGRGGDSFPYLSMAYRF